MPALPHESPVMPDYIASGKDAHSESSIKVTAFTNIEAFQAAKRQLPIVSKLERIEPDGTFTPVTGLPFDDIRTEIRSLNDLHDEAGSRQRAHAIPDWLKLTIFVVVLIGTATRLLQCAAALSQNQPASATTQQSDPATRPPSTKQH